MPSDDLPTLAPGPNPPSANTPPAGTTPPSGTPTPPHPETVTAPLTVGQPAPEPQGPATLAPAPALKPPETLTAPLTVTTHAETDGPTTLAPPPAHSPTAASAPRPASSSITAASTPAAVAHTAAFALSPTAASSPSGASSPTAASSARPSAPSPGTPATSSPSSASGTAPGNDLATFAGPAPTAPQPNAAASAPTLDTLAPAAPARRGPNPDSILEAPAPDVERRDAQRRAGMLSVLGDGQRAPDPQAAGTDADGLPPEPPAFDALALPKKIGKFEIVKLLGEGGFGSVYLAEQKQPVKRKVALKVVKLGMDTAEVLQRFEAERQALALMDHPHVARVYDAGVTDRGQPYFAMEYVEGVPLNKYVDEQSLVLDARLNLFIDICRAVQHAHSKGLIHRDLKPGNIIVHTVDGKHTPKVIDFGIAKATGPSLSDDGGFKTESGRLIGTPEYMSPEQCAGSPDIDTRTDVYALGVILYEVLTGQLPFDSKVLRAGGIDGITKIIREQEPPRPSAKLTLLGLEKDAPFIEKVVRARKTDYRHLQRAIKGDLDWIVLRCLEKDRNRRYETANALALDVLRHLSNEPVLAGPPDFKYRFGKFARRNKILLGTVTAIAASLIIGLVVSTTQYVRAERARAAEQIARVEAEKARDEEARAKELARQERDVAMGSLGAARIEKANTEAVNAFFLNILNSADPAKSRGRELTVREVVSRASAAFDAGVFKDRPLTEIAVRSSLGNVLRTLGLAEQSAAQLKAAADLCRKHVNPAIPDYGQTLNRLALSARDLGDFQLSLSLFEEVLANQSKLFGEDSPQYATVLHNLGLTHLSIGRNADAQRYLRRSIDTLSALKGDHADTLVQWRNHLASAHHQAGELDAAEKAYRQTLNEIMTRVGGDHPATALALRNLGLLLHDRRLTPGYESAGTEAAKCLEQAMQTMRRVYPPEHPDYRNVLESLADIHRDLGNLEPAIAAVSESLSLWTKVDGPAAPGTLETLSSLAALYQRKNELPEALKYSADLLARAKILSDTDPDQGRRLAGYNALHATLLLDSGRPQDAEPFVRRALALREKYLPQASWQRANAASLLGAVLLAQGKAKDAEPILFEAHQTLLNDPTTPPATLDRSKSRLVALYTALNKPEEANKYRQP